MKLSSDVMINEVELLHWSQEWEIKISSECRTLKWFDRRLYFHSFTSPDKLDSLIIYNLRGFSAATLLLI